MGNTIEMFVANPAGNITAMVLTPVSRDQYQDIAARILDVDFKHDYGISFTGNETELYCEQVAYILPSDDSSESALPRMEMCGLEFCGNASRSFAYYLACKTGNTDRPYETQVSVSGCDHPLKAWAEPHRKWAQIQMPVPADTSVITLPPQVTGFSEITGLLVNMDGISHLILQDIEASEELFEKIRQYIYDKTTVDLPALGVMFMDTENQIMTPVVYVRDVDTTYFEGSCASGTTAASCALALSADTERTDSAESLTETEYTFRQPSGTLYTKVTKKEGLITDIFLSGLLELSPIITIEL